MAPAARVTRRIVLIGGGHTHVEVLRSFGDNPEPGVALTIVAKEIAAPYSGMLPGFIAGHYSHAECHIDVARLAQRCSARMIHGEATAIDRGNRLVIVSGLPPIAYDLLSLNTGITPLLDGIHGAAQHALAVKPISTFAPRWRVLEAAALTPGGPRRFAVIGTGAAGFELVLAIRHRLRQRAPDTGIDPDAFSFALIGASDLLASHNTRARRLARGALAASCIQVTIGEAATAVSATEVTLANGRTVAADAVLIATNAAAPAWFAHTGLPRDRDGFIAVRPTLQVLDDDDVFAAGDCATVLQHVREKSGVFAVRQGPPLTDNLRRRARGAPVLPFLPQRRALSLLSLGERSAIASRGPFAASGRWVWRWKDHVDRRFMARYAGGRQG